MRKITLNLMVLTLSTLFSFTSFTQNIGDYRSKNNGNWNDSNTWEIFNGTSWVNATNPPNESLIPFITLNHTVSITDSISISGSTNVQITPSATLNIFKSINNRGSIQNQGIINWYAGNITTSDSLIVGNILNRTTGTMNIQVITDVSTFNQRITNAGQMYKFGENNLIFNEFKESFGVFNSEKTGYLTHYNGILDIRITCNYEGSFVNYGIMKLNNKNGMSFKGQNCRNNNIIQGNYIRFEDTIQQELIGTGTIERLLIQNPKGINIKSPIFVEKELNLLWGKVNLFGNSITLGTSITNKGSLVGGSDTAYCYDGIINRWVNSADSIRFPIGTGAAFLQATVVIDSLSSGGLLSTQYQVTNPLSWGLSFTDNDNYTVFSTCPSCGIWEIMASEGLQIKTYKLALAVNNYPGITQPENLRIIYRAIPSVPWGLRGLHSSGSGISPKYTARRNNLAVFGEFAIGGGSENALLPVELTDFTAYRKGNSSVLNWETASELNSSHFDIERSNEDAQSFATIGRVKANGTTQLPQKYTFMDEKPSKGVNYYRLKMVDKDVKSAFSRIISLYFEGKTKVWLYPNPFNEKLVVETENTEGGTLNYDIEITDITGKLHFNKKSIDNQQFNFNLSQLGSGVYFAKIIMGREIETFKIVKK